MRETTILAHRASPWATGDADKGFTELHEQRCAVCGAVIVPLLGKVREGMTVDYTIWISGNYEHVERPETAHAPVPMEA